VKYNDSQAERFKRNEIKAVLQAFPFIELVSLLFLLYPLVPNEFAMYSIFIFAFGNVVRAIICFYYYRERVNIGVWYLTIFKIGNALITLFFLYSLVLIIWISVNKFTPYFIVAAVLPTILICISLPFRELSLGTQYQKEILTSGRFNNGFFNPSVVPDWKDGQPVNKAVINTTSRIAAIISGLGTILHSFLYSGSLIGGWFIICLLLIMAWSFSYFLWIGIRDLYYCIKSQKAK
jgi:hypothetical protein